MPRVEEFQILPFGWENDPEEEQYKLSTIDYLTTTTYLPMTLFFKLDEAEKPKAVEILKKGLERTLSQIRQFVGVIEKIGDSQYAIVKRKKTTVKFVVQYLDSPEDNFPSFSDIANAHFASSILGDVRVLCNAPMTCGTKPESHPDNRPVVSSFKATFIPGGVIFIIHGHHYINGITGFNAMVQQLAANCYAVAHETEFPSFDKRWLDRSVLDFLDSHKPSEAEVLAPPRPGKNMQHRPSQSLLFHLSKSKATALKKAASSGSGTWISTYDAVCAYMWRVLSRIREPLYKPNADFQPLWATGVSLHKLFTNPPLPAGFQGNSQIDIRSTKSAIPQPSLAEVISEAPLSTIATYLRQLTDSVTADLVANTLQEHAKVRNKGDLSINLASFPPMSILVSDWRVAHLCKFDFGFGELSGWRHLFGGVPLCQVLVYAPHKGPAGDDEGMELQITFEIELAQQLINDPEWSKYFEFRGIDASDEPPSSNEKSKL